MKKIFDEVSHSFSKKVTNTYRTSFSMACKMLSKNIRQDIYNIYGFVRFADEIVDSFHDYDRNMLFEEFNNNDDLTIQKEDIVNQIKEVFDPEIPVNIYDLGLVYLCDIDQNGNFIVEMTITAPGCPVAGEMPQWVADALTNVAGVGEVTVALVWDPPWDQEKMSEEAKLELGMF